MFKNKLLALLLAPFMMYIGEEGGGGAAEDRGDDFTPTEDDDGAAAAAALAEKEAAEKEAADKAAAEAAVEDDDETDEKDDEKNEKKPAKKDSRIPLSRHEQILGKERAERERLANELAKYQKGQAQADTNKELAAAEAKLEGLQEKLDNAIVDGKLDEVKALRREIRALENQVNDQKVEFRAAEAEARAVESVRYDAIVDRIEAAYPQMAVGSETFDQEAVNEVLELKDAYVLKGYAPSAALQKAVRYVLGAETTKQTTAVNVTPRAAEEDVAAKLKEERKAAANQKALDALKKQPADSSKIGLEHDKAGGSHMIDAKVVMKMSQADFAKLGEEQLAKLRGDTL